MKKWQYAFLKKQGLPAHYIQDAEPILSWFNAAYTHAQVQSNRLPFCLGINGAQGSGKSTLAHYLARSLEAQGLSIAVVSLDDFYLSPEERSILAKQHHPLLATRGVPGTHAIKLAIETVRLFKAQQAFTLPRFDKSQDRPFLPKYWQTIEVPPDILIFEGWCVGLKSEPLERLCHPCNTLEALQDTQGRYRRYVNQCLAADYQTLFSLIDKLVYLNVQTFERVYQWRQQQEQQLKCKSGKGMTEQEVSQFIQYFERLTRWGMASLPEQSDLSVTMDSTHRFNLT
ncbi:kinase [Pseudoalteromonas sp. MMG013]|uniref:kinase n=1 Tax=Pseudoalteromonas sp. MMG013 TaxID=2822687 RepID=UPI001B370B2D|nr:kinase [Pseudoalteromonas sp. MMG013]MBQ4862573.1 kinase [Pseudoalteromonas sp. MMG013]